MSGPRRSERIVKLQIQSSLSPATTKGETKDRVLPASHASRRKRSAEQVERSGRVSKHGARLSKRAAQHEALEPKTNAQSPAAASKHAPHAGPLGTVSKDEHGEQEVFWLLKAEPLPRYENGVNVAFSIDDLAACTSPEPWSGVRNLQARNNMKSMRKDDLGFFYHSNAKPSGVVGILRVVKEAEVDKTAFDSADPYYDPKSDKNKPKWFCVSVEFVEKFKEVVDLAKIKSYAETGGPLAGMQLVTNSRLSVSRVTKDQWGFVINLAKDPASA